MLGAHAATVGEAVDSGVVIVRAACTRAWAAQAVCAFGVAALFVGLRAHLEAVEAGGFVRLGTLVLALGLAPLWVSLYRLALGLEGQGSRGLAGLRFGADEVRLLGLGGAFALAAILAVLPLVALSAVLFVLLHDLGQVRLGALGDVQVSFLAVAAAWLGGFALFAYGCGRLALVPAASIDAGRLVVLEAWSRSRGRARAALTGWLLAQGPALLALSLVGLIDAPLTAAEAGLCGLGLGLAAAFVQAPMTVGVLTRLYLGAAPRAEPAGPIGPDAQAELSPG